MRSLLERAIVHLLNEDHDAAEALMHQFMVERARQIHTSLRQGEEAVLSEGWDDEISSEEYFSDGDLEGFEDEETGEDMDMGDDMEGMGGDEFSAGDASADVEDDLAGDDMEGMGDEMDADVEGAENPDATVDERVDDLEDQLEELTREFETMMAELDGGDEPTEDGEDLEGMGDEPEASGEEDFGGDDETADTEGSEEGEETEEEPEDEMAEGAEMDEDEMDEITESVIAELEKVLIKNATTDGEEIGDAGKKVSTNSKSPLPQEKIGNRNGAKPVTIKSTNHSGYERETAPTVKDMKKAKNTVKGKADSVLDKVSKDGDSSALLNKDYAGLTKKNTKSVID